MLYQYCTSLYKTMNTQNIAPNQGTSVYPTEELAYTSSLLLEGLNIADPNQQEDHFGALPSYSMRLIYQRTY